MGRFKHALKNLDSFYKIFTPENTSIGTESELNYKCDLCGYETTSFEKISDHDCENDKDPINIGQTSTSKIGNSNI